MFWVPAGQAHHNNRGYVCDQKQGTPPCVDMSGHHQNTRADHPVVTHEGQLVGLPAVEKRWADHVDLSVIVSTLDEEHQTVARPVWHRWDSNLRPPWDQSYACLLLLNMGATKMQQPCSDSVSSRLTTRSF